MSKTGVTTLFVLAIAAAIASGPAQGAERVLAYIGTDAPDPNRAAGGNGENNNHGEGIYLVSMDPATGKLSAPQLAVKTASPIWLTTDRDKKFLYAVGAAGFNGTRGGSVSAYIIDPQSGVLTLIDTVASQGVMPAYISIDPSGKFLLVANYGGGAETGNVAVLPIHADGGLGDAVNVAHTVGPLNPARAADNPPGNFAVSDHRIPHVHMVAPDASGKFIVADDAGLDQIFLWRLDATGTLVPNAPPSTATTPGSAPRHFVFSPNGRHFYQLHEQDSMLASYDFDPETGALQIRQKLSTLPPGFAGSNLAAELLISRDGLYLYASNRLNDTIAEFAADGRGGIKALGEVPIGGDYPRSMAMDPSGRFLYVLNERGDSITTFRIDPKTGRLHATDQMLPIGNPVTMVFAH